MTLIDLKLIWKQLAVSSVQPFIIKLLYTLYHFYVFFPLVHSTEIDK